MMAQSATTAVEPCVGEAQISPETAAEAPVAIERPADAAGKVSGRWQKKHLLSALICVLIGLGMSMAVFGKNGRLSSLLRPRPLADGESSSNHSGSTGTSNYYRVGHSRWSSTGSSTAETEQSHNPTYFPLEPRFGIRTEPGAVDSKSVFENWNLPGAEEMEEALPLLNKHRKLFLSELVQQNDKKASIPFSEGQAVLRAVARHLTGGVTDQLVGLTLGLENMVPLAGGDAGTRTPRLFKVTKYLGEGTFKVVLEVLDVESRHFLALNLFFSDYNTEEDRDDDIGRVEFQMNEAAAHEQKTATKSCGPTAPALASDKRGIAVPLFTAEITGMPEVLRGDGVYVLRKVHVMERLHGDMHALMKQMMLFPLETKVYIAKRLLLQVLHLQEARVSHNDIKWSNLFMRADGSFLLGDFGSSCLLGERMNPLSGVTPSYTEPSLLSDFSLYLSQGLPALPDDKSDMWSLGVLLFELFTGGELPYGYQGNPNFLRDMSAHANALVNADVSPLRLVPEMQKAQTPRRWQELIVNLLEPRRSKRISGREAAREFSDIFLGGRSRVFTFHDKM